MGCGNTRVNAKEEKIPYSKTNNKKDESILKKFEASSKSSTIVEWKNLTIDQVIYLDLLSYLSENNQIKSFIFKNVDISGDFDKLIELAKILMHKENLKNLEFHSLSNLGNKKGKSIAKIMKHCKNVERIVIDNIDLEEEDAEFIGCILKNFTESLVYFQISLVFFGRQMRNFLDGLYSNNEIQEIVLNKINLTEDYFIFLLEAVSTNKCLIRLDVSNNPIKEGARGFIDYPLRNLKTLQMNNCDIDDNNLSVLLKGLYNNRCLRILEINQNQITADACNDIALFFQGNDYLETIYMLNNKIKKDVLCDYLNSDNLSKVVLD